MERELITVIIPVYKVEPYLEKCVQSVLAQTYRDLEIILVDDGSPDGCPAICDAFAARDSRVRVIHKENGGLSSARNAGLDAAHGAYIGFVDSDDYIAPEMYETLYRYVTAEGADLGICDCLNVHVDESVEDRMPAFRLEVIDTMEAFRRMEYDQGWPRYVTAWNRLYRRRLFEQMRFLEGRWNEDLFLAHYLYAECNRIVVVPGILYYHVHTDGSIMHSPVCLKKLDEVDGYLERYDYYRRQGLKKLASGSLRRAYIRLWQVVKGLDMRQAGREVWPRVRRTAAAQLRELNPSAAALTAKYLTCLLFGPGGRHRGETT